MNCLNKKDFVSCSIELKEGVSTEKAVQALSDKEATNIEVMTERFISADLKVDTLDSFEEIGVVHIKQLKTRKMHCSVAATR